MRKYFVNDVEVSKEDFYSELEEAVNIHVEEIYDDILDECYDDVVLGSYTYSASEVFKKVDPIAYRCSRNDYASSYLSDIEYELDFGHQEFNGSVFEIKEEK